MIDDGPDVGYVADLVEVIVDPTPGDPDVQRLLTYIPPTAASEDAMWDGKVKTFYAIRNCTRIAKPFPFTERWRLNAEKTLDANYGHAYALVRERDRPHSRPATHASRGPACVKILDEPASSRTVYFVRKNAG